MQKLALVAALLFSACSCVTAVAAENIPANSQIFKEAKSLPKIPANPKVFTDKAEVIQMSQQVPGMPVHNGIVIFERGLEHFGTSIRQANSLQFSVVKEEPEFMEKNLVLLNLVTL